MLERAEAVAVFLLAYNAGTTIFRGLLHIGVLKSIYFRPRPPNSLLPRVFQTFLISDLLNIPTYDIRLDRHPEHTRTHSYSLKGLLNPLC